MKPNDLKPNQQYNDGLPKVIAVDLDGTILQPVWDVPDTTIHNYEGKFGEVMPLARESLNVLWIWGYKIIIWTTRNDIEGVRKYLVEKKIPFDEINKNIPEVKRIFGWGPGKGEEPRKIYYTHLIDDRAGFNGDWAAELKKYKPILLEKMEKDDIEGIVTECMSSLSGDTPTV